ncbi:MAG: hypothetical protein K2G59_04050, partial [Muribaculaceae bacterium]|nr:hypothetical protein [Muribaculaceae bacterium]
APSSQDKNHSEICDPSVNKYWGTGSYVGPVPVKQRPLPKKHHQPERSDRQRRASRKNINPQAAYIIGIFREIRNFAVKR